MARKTLAAILAVYINSPCVFVLVFWLVGCGCLLVLALVVFGLLVLCGWVVGSGWSAVLVAVAVGLVVVCVWSLASVSMLNLRAGLSR